MGLQATLEALDRAMTSERQFIAEFIRRDELWRAAQAQARLQALSAFKQTLLTEATQDQDREH